MSIKLDEITRKKKMKMDKRVRQWDTICPKYFTLALEDLFRLYCQKKCIWVDGKMLNHLRSADDVVILASTSEEIQIMPKQLHHAFAKAGLKICWRHKF